MDWLKKLKARSARRRTIMKLDLNIDYIVDDDDRKNPLFRTNTAISMTVLRTACNAVKGGPTQANPNGEGNKSRDAVRVAAGVTNALTKLKNAHTKDEKSTAIDLDVNEAKHVRDCMESWMKERGGVPESWSGWYELLREMIDKAVDTGETMVAAKTNGSARAVEKTPTP